MNGRAGQPGGRAAGRAAGRTAQDGAEPAWPTYRVAEHDKGAVVVSGLGGNAYWDESTGYLVVQVGRDVLWVNTGQIQAADKLAPAKALVAIVRKRL